MADPKEDARPHLDRVELGVEGSIAGLAAVQRPYRHHIRRSSSLINTASTSYLKVATRRKTRRRPAPGIHRGQSGGVLNVERAIREVISLINDLRRKATTILTAIHDVNIVPRITDQVLLLDRRVVELSPAREVLVKRGLLKGLGLDLPTIAGLFCTLKDEGYEIGDIPFTSDEALAALAGLIKKSNCARPPRPKGRGMLRAARPV